MTLFEIINILEQIALLQPNVRSTSCGSVYEYLNANPSVEYDVVHISQTQHRQEEDYDYYGFNIFYISRLDHTLENNRLFIQSIGKESLTNIIKTFCEKYDVDMPILRFYPFQQRFQDECAGVYLNLEIAVPVDWLCVDDEFGVIGEVNAGSDAKLQIRTITITENGTQVVYPSEGYDGISKITIKTEVPPEYLPARLYDLTATTNSTYTPAAGFDGFGKVVVDVPQGSSAVLGSLSFNEEGEFHHTYNAQEQGLDGYSSVTINILNDCECEDCQPYYDNGYDDGVADQKAKLSSRNITKNGEYTNSDGWSAITVNVAGDCSSAYTQGYNDAKSEMTGVTFTQNGTYLNNSGYSAVTVNVSSGAPEETTIITYKTINANKGIVPLDSRGKYYDQDGIERTVISHLFDSTTSTGTITISGKIAKIDGHMFIPHDNEQPLASDRWNIETVNLPNSITEIGEAVFNDCTQILYFNFPSNLKSIGKNAFSYCGRLRAIDIPSSCVSVGPWAFYNAGNGLTTKLYLRNGTRVLDISSFKVDSGRTGTYWDFGIKEIYFPEEASSDRSQFPYIYVNEDRPTSRVTPYTFSGVPTNGTIHLKSGSSRQLTEDWAMALPSWTVVYDL